MDIRFYALEQASRKQRSLALSNEGEGLIVYFRKRTKNKLRWFTSSQLLF